MSVLTIAIVGAAISVGFYYINRDTTTCSKKQLRDSTAMVFIMSVAVLLLARFLGLGGSEGGGGGGGGDGGAGKARGGGGGGGGGLPPPRAVPLDYVIGGEPPF